MAYLNSLTEVLGFQLVYRKELGGGHVMEQVVGVSGAYLRNALLEGPDGYRVELIEYDSPEDRVIFETTSMRCRFGSFDVCCDRSARNAKSHGPLWMEGTGEPQTAPSGNNHGLHPRT